MARKDANLLSLLNCIDAQLQKVDSGRGVALVDRTALLGSINRGTQEPERQTHTGIVAFLNIDLEFGAYDLSEALDGISAALTSGLPSAGWSCDIRAVDPECRGGLWAEVRAQPTAGTLGTSDSEPSGPDAGNGFLVHIFLAENMSSSVTAAHPTLGTGSSGTSASESDDGFVSWPVDPTKALQQQQNLLAKAESRVKRARSTPGGAAAWLDKAACGVAEAERLFWARQPAEARSAARAAHRAWRQAAEQGGLKGTGGEVGPEGGAAASHEDPVFHMLDVVALHTHAYGKVAAHSAAGDALGPEQALLKGVFSILAAGGHGEGGRVLEVAMPGGILAGEAGTGAGSGDGAEKGHAAAGAAAGPGGLLVRDPCFPLHDLCAAACRALGQGQDLGAGADVLRQVSGRALQSL